MECHALARACRQLPSTASLGLCGAVVVPSTVVWSSVRRHVNPVRPLSLWICASPSMVSWPSAPQVASALSQHRQASESHAACLATADSHRTPVTRGRHTAPDFSSTRMHAGTAQVPRRPAGPHAFLGGSIVCGAHFVPVAEAPCCPSSAMETTRRM